MDGFGNLHLGFRFHPTEHEIITYFLERKMCGLDFPVHMVQDVLDVSMYEPWDLPDRSPMPREDRVWYFFNAPVSKYANSKMIKRTTNSGFWKKTGEDRAIWDKQGKNKIGFKKNLVFYEGRAPNGVRTKWVMHEYHSLNAASYPKEYVLFRLKRKSGVEPDSGNRATENTNPQFLPQRNHDQFHEMLLDNSPSSLLSTVQPEQGTLYSDGFNNEHILLDDYFLETSEQEDAFMQSLLVDEGEFTAEQEDAFVNSLLAEEGEPSGEISVNTLLHGFNPTVPLSGVYAGDSSDKDTEIVYQSKGGLQETSDLFYENAILEGYRMMANFSTSSSDDGTIMELDTLSINSDVNLPGIFCLDRVVDELAITRTRNSSNSRTPKSYKSYGGTKMQMDCEVFDKAVSSKVEVREAADHAVDLPQTRNSNVKIGKDKQMARQTRGRTRSNSSSSSNRSGSIDHLKSSFILMEAPNLSQETNPPSVFLLNAIVSLVLIIFIIREIMYLH